VVEGLAPLLGRLEIDPELLLEPALAHVLFQRLRPQ